MNLFIILGIVCGLIALRFLKPNPLLRALLWLLASYLGLRFAPDPPLPSSVVSMFMAIIALCLLAYLTATKDRMQDVVNRISVFLLDRRFMIPLIMLLVGLPILVATRVYVNATSEPSPPISVRTVHPPPPISISFRETEIDLVAGDNPYRELETSDPEAFQGHLENGLRIYYENCLLCHGSELNGDGLFAHGLDPIPTNFRDATTIAILQESYLFWRIAKGAPGLPDEATPWSSSMPAWEPFLTEEEIWDVISFLYDYTGQRPRAVEIPE